MQYAQFIAVLGSANGELATEHLMQSSAPMLPNKDENAAM